MMMWAVVSSIMAHIISLIICYSATVIFFIVLAHGGQKNWKEEKKCTTQRQVESPSETELWLTGQTPTDSISLDQSNQPISFKADLPATTIYDDSEQDSR